MTSCNETLNWFMGMDERTKMGFVKGVLNCCSLEELKVVKLLVNYAEKRKRPIPRQAQKIRKKQRKLLESGSAAAVPASSSSVPVSAAVVPAPPKVMGPVFWWEKYEEENVVAFDTELVILKTANDFGKNSPGTIAVSDFAGDIIYSEKIYQKPGSFITDSVSVGITGFRTNDLKEGKPFEDVKDEMIGLMNGALVVTQAGHGDFKAFGLVPGQFDTFDLQHKFVSQTGEDKHGFPVMQPISLRRLVMHYFDVDIQKGVHSAETDAQFTMKLFHIYQKLARELGMTERSDTFPIDQFANIKKLDKIKYGKK